MLLLVAGADISQCELQTQACKSKISANALSVSSEKGMLKRLLYLCYWYLIPCLTMAASNGVIRFSRTSRWDLNVEKLEAYIAVNGCLDFEQADRSLSNFVRKQRNEYKLSKKGLKSTLTVERKKQLEGIGFIFDVGEHKWQKKFMELKQYKEHDSLNSVPSNNTDHKLVRYWADRQRKEYHKLRSGKKSSMTPDRVALLDSISFDWNEYDVRNLQSIERVLLNVGNTACQKLKYMPKSKKYPGPTIFEIDGDNVSHLTSIHRITTSKLKGVTPRYRASPKIVEKLNPTLITSKGSPRKGSRQQQLISSTDAVDIHFPNGTKNGVFFASSQSKNKHLRAIHTLYRKYGKELEFLYSKVPNGLKHVDDLAGGCYLPYGFGCISPGPDGCPDTYNRKQVPYLRMTARSPAVRRIFDIYAIILGAIAKAASDLFPDILEDNQKLGDGCMDFACPAADKQHTEIEERRVWYTHQTILRLLGAQDKNMSVDDALIALHCDESDHPSIQPLIYFPIGGKSGLGGHVPGSDLLIFEEETGGASVRIDTSISDTVTVAFVNSARQLHATAEEEEEASTNVDDNKSMRFITYLRGPIVEYAEANKNDPYAPRPFINLQSSRDGNDHFPLEGEAIVDCMKVAIISEKIWKECFISIDSNGKIDLVFPRGKRKKQWNQRLYDCRCAHSMPTSCEVCDEYCVI